MTKTDVARIYREIYGNVRCTDSDFLFAKAIAEKAREVMRDELLTALEKMNRAYINLMENGRDRIVMLGGDCDPLDVMERNDPHLYESRATIASVKDSK